MSRTKENQKRSISQLPEQVNYGTQPEERVEDYDWDEDIMV